MDGESSSANEGVQPQPMAVQAANMPPPFLSKTYDMVDDPATDAIVSWSRTNNSFVVWNHPEFARDLLPKYFKHNNFSSFVRQLNTYGFRKVDPDRWEFANEGFLRGQKHLLKNITRRRPGHGQSHQQPQQPHGQSSTSSTVTVGPCVEVGKFGLEEEVERLKRDKNVLMQELVRLRQQQQTTDTQLQTMAQRLQGMEQRQQQMMSFLAKAVQSPGFLAQFVQQQNESTRRISEANKKRRLKPDGIIVNGHPDSPDGQIVKYQPYMNDTQAMLKHFMKMDSSFDNNHELESGGSPNRVSGVILQEVPATSGPGLGISGHAPTEVSPVTGPHEPPSISASSEDIMMTELPQIPGVASDTIAVEDFLGSEPGNDDFGPLEFNHDDLDFSNFLEDFLVDMPAPEGIDPTSGDQGSEEQGSENVDRLTEKMGLLTPDSEGVI